MIKYLIITILSLLFFIINYGYSQTNTKFNISGKLSTNIDGLLYISYFDKEEKFITDSLRVKDSIFNLSGNISGPTLAKINLINKNLKISFNAYSNQIFLEPKNMFLNINLNKPYSIKLVGSKTECEYINQIKKNKFLVDKITLAQRNLEKADIQNKIRYTRLIDNYNLKIQKNNILFIKNNSQSYVSSYLLYYLLSEIPMEDIKKLFNYINVPMKNDFYTKQIFLILKRYDSVSTKKSLTSPKILNEN